MGPSFHCRKFPAKDQCYWRSTTRKRWRKFFCSNRLSNSYSWAVHASVKLWDANFFTRLPSRSWDGPNRRFFCLYRERSHYWWHSWTPTCTRSRR